MPSTPKPPLANRGFTLVELLIVVVIIGLISAAALPIVLPALNERRVSESARLVQAILAGTRDAAIRANAPRGIRLLPDPVFNGQNGNPLLAYNRIIPIEPAPDYSEGLVNLVQGFVNPNNAKLVQLKVVEVQNDPVTGLPNNPTSWYWNLRQGDKIRFNDSGAYYTIAGPMTIGPYPDPNAPVVGNQKLSNPERYINTGPPAGLPKAAEYLILTNGTDDNANGFVDEAFDGLDNDGDGRIDPSFNGLDDDGDGIIDNEFYAGEFETEKFDGSLGTPFANLSGLSYTIVRRPVVSAGAREVTLPAGIVIDMTTWNAATSSQFAKVPNTPVLQPERSRLPIDPYTLFVDILIAPNGQVVQGGAGSSNGDYNRLAPTSSQPFYHFWLTEREGVVAPLFGLQSQTNTSKSNLLIPALNPGYGPLVTSTNYMLPMPKGTASYNNTFLTGERRLVTLFVKTGQISTNSIESFNIHDTNAPFYDAQTGIKESQ